MTVSSGTSRVSYSGNGATTGFSYTFKIFADSDLVVSLKDNATGVSTTQTLTTDYTVSGAGNSSGGTVTFVTAPASGKTVIIRRELPFTQETDYVENDPFPAQAHEDALDKLTMLTQQNDRGVDRSIRKPVGDAVSISMELDKAADRADKLLGFDSNGSPSTVVVTADAQTIASVAADISTLADIEDGTVSTNAITNVNTIRANVSTVSGISSDVTTVSGNTSNINTVAGISSDVTIVADNVADITNFADVYQGGKATDPTLRNDGSALQAGDLYFNTTNDELRVYSGSIWQSGTAGIVSVQNFTGDGSDTIFVLSAAPYGENNTQIYIDGVYQQKNTYSLSGSTITFSEAPPNLADIEVVTISTLALGQTDSSLTLYTPAGTGAVQTTVQTRLRQLDDGGAIA